jgi:hypothetical protein
MLKDLEDSRKIDQGVHEASPVSYLSLFSLSLAHDEYGADELFERDRTYPCMLLSFLDSSGPVSKLLL